MWVCFWALYYVPLIYTYILQISLYFDYYSFVVLSEVLEGYAFCFLLFSKDYFCNSGSFVALCKNFRIISYVKFKNKIKLKKKTINDGEGVEKRERSCTVDGNVN